MTSCSMLPLPIQVPRAGCLPRLQLSVVRRPFPGLRAFKGGAQEEKVSKTPADAPLPSPEAMQPRPLSSYDEPDFGGYESGTMPQMTLGELSEDEEAAVQEEERKGRQGASCLLVQEEGNRAEYEAQLQAMGEWTAGDEKTSDRQILESVDGMVGNYECDVVEKRRELQEAADDYTRILAELVELETAAGIRSRSTVGSDATSSAEVQEGAGVEDLE